MKLKKSEKRLLVVFLSLFAVIVGGFGSTLLFNHFSNSLSELEALEVKRDALEHTLAQSTHWANRRAWINTNIPSHGSREEASGKLLELVSATVESAGLKVLDKQVQTNPDAMNGSTSTGPSVYFDRVSVVLELSGEEEDIFRWLHTIQQPESFVGITQIDYSRTEDKSLCTAHVSLWFRESPTPNLARNQ